MKKLFIVIWLIVTTTCCFSQAQEINKTFSSESHITTNMFDVRRNAIYTEDILSFSYERLLPVSNHLGIGLKAGFMIWDPIIPLVETAVVSGGTKHFGEAGVGVMLVNNDEDNGFDFITFRLGYRYQAPKGFLFKASALYSPDNFVLPWIAVGYAF